MVKLQVILEERVIAQQTLLLQHLLGVNEETTITEGRAAENTFQTG
jgi:hypothetical protein